MLFSVLFRIFSAVFGSLVIILNPSLVVVTMNLFLSPSVVRPVTEGRVELEAAFQPVPEHTELLPVILRSGF